MLSSGDSKSGKGELFSRVSVAYGQGEDGKEFEEGRGGGDRCLEAVATGLLCLGECSSIISSRRFTFSSLPAEDRNVCFLNSCALFPRGVAFILFQRYVKRRMRFLKIHQLIYF